MAYRPDGVVLDLHPGRGHPLARRGSVIDLSRNANSGTLYGAPALSFDGANDTAAVATPFDAWGGHAVAIVGAWVYCDSGNSTARDIYDERFANNTERLEITVQADDTIRVRGRCASGGNLASVQTTLTLSQDVWHSVIVSVGSQGAGAYPESRIWVDGAIFMVDDLDATWASATYAAGAPTNQRFDLTYNTYNDFEGYMTCMFLRGADGWPTTAHAEKFHNFPHQFLEGFSCDAFYHCVDAAGNTVSDGSGNGHDLTVDGATQWDVGANLGDSWETTAGTGNDSFTGGRRHFDGTDDYLSVADSSELRFDAGTEDFSLVVWFKRNATGALQYLIDKRDADDDGYRLIINADDTITGSVDAIDCTTAATVGDTNDHCVAFAVDRNGAGGIWVDGAVDVASGQAIGSEVMATTAAVNIGRDGVAPYGNYFDGDIYKVMIFARCLSTGEIKALYDQGPYK